MCDKKLTCDFFRYFCQLWCRFSEILLYIHQGKVREFFLFWSLATLKGPVHGKATCLIWPSNYSISFILPTCSIYVSRFHIVQSDKTLNSESITSKETTTSWPPEEIRWATAPVPGWPGIYWVRGFWTKQIFSGWYNTTQLSRHLRNNVPS